MFKLVDDWKHVVKISYSFWFCVLALFLLHASDLIYLIFRIDTNPKAWTVILTAVLISAGLGRLVDQTKSGAWRRRAFVGLFFLIVFTVCGRAMAHDQCAADAPEFAPLAYEHISGFEGDNKSGSLHVSYRDIAGVWTVCYGHTKTAKPNQYKTDEQCRKLLMVEIEEYRAGLHVYFTPETLAHRLPVTRDVAYTSLAYNIGIKRAGQSTATRRLNKGDIEGGCEALTWWNKARVNGSLRRVRGLVNRRNDERLLCLKT